MKRTLKHSQAGSKINQMIRQRQSVNVDTSTCCNNLLKYFTLL